MIAFFSGLVAVAKAIPAVKDAIEKFVAWYIGTQIQAMREEHRNAISEAIKNFDQRPIENAIGSPVAGLPSGVPGSTISDRPPPGVRQ